MWAFQAGGTRYDAGALLENIWSGKTVVHLSPMVPEVVHQCRTSTTTALPDDVAVMEPGIKVYHGRCSHMPAYNSEWLSGLDLESVSCEKMIPACLCPCFWHLL